MCRRGDPVLGCVVARDGRSLMWARGERDPSSRNEVPGLLSMHAGLAPAPRELRRCWHHQKDVRDACGVGTHVPLPQRGPPIPAADGREASELTSWPGLSNPIRIMSKSENPV